MASSQCTAPSQCTGIAPNPDIAGIGVRVAVYVQALLSVIYAIHFARKGEISAEGFKTMARISVNISLTAGALLVSTIIQAVTLGISLYHTLIVLQLSWINSMTFMTVYSLRTMSDPSWYRRNEDEYLSLPSPFTPDALVASAHVAVVGGVGLWTWLAIETFGNQPECNPDTFLVILRRSIHVLPWYQCKCGFSIACFISVASLALYGGSAIPVLNIQLFGFIFMFGILVFSAPTEYPLLLLFRLIDCLRLLIRSVQSSLGFPTAPLDVTQSTNLKRSRRFLYFFVGIATAGTAMGILIVDTELMIHRSASIVQPGEGAWTLGQTLALLLLFLPIGDAVRVVFGIEEESWLLFFWGVRLVKFYRRMVGGRTEDVDDSDADDSEV
ncbi:hypothetical protein C8R46DRAFT_1214925 [Mycena filopes]|nr:hypothetical protein C8R46DRAFT_1214925 [Mycena filopes]